MAIKIRCSDCRKRISIDEAFAGGVCRCPYCTALVFVPAGASASARPTRPGSPGGRPEAPGARPAGPDDEPARTDTGITTTQQAREAIEAAASSGENVPVAAPVRMQGIAAIIMLVVLLALLGGGGYVVVDAMSGDDNGQANGRTNGQGKGGVDNGTGTKPPVKKINPFTHPGVQGPGVDGMPIDSPIVYCIEAGSSMDQTLNYAVAMTYVSVRTLTGDHTFNVIIGQEGGADDTSWYRLLLPTYTGGGPAGEAAIRKPLDNVGAVGAPNVQRLLQAAVALEPKPHTIVYFGNKPLFNAAELAKLAADKGIKLVTICLTYDIEITGHMAKLAEGSGGTSAAHSERQLMRWADAAGRFNGN